MRSTLAMMAVSMVTSAELDGGPMDVREALYTTRAMRRVKADPVPREVQMRILDAAIRAPSGGNSQSWRFMLVDDRETCVRLGELYSECIDQLWATVYKGRVDSADEMPDTEESRQWARIQKSVDWARKNFATYPLLLLAFERNDPSGGSIFPAVWNAMLQARADGVGSSLTTVLAMRANETFDLLGVPSDKGWNMACCVPMGYPTGRWGVAKRTPAHEVSYRNKWGQPVGFEIPEPLWP